LHATVQTAVAIARYVRPLQLRLGIGSNARETIVRSEPSYIGFGAAPLVSFVVREKIQREDNAEET
jgi:hypothetical protein